MTRYSESSAPKQDEWDIARRAIECTRCNSWTSSERRQKKKRMYSVHNNRILRKRTKQWMHTFGTTLKTNSQLEYFHNTIQWFLLDKMHRDRASKRLKRNDSIKLRMRNKLSQSFVVVTKENTQNCAIIMIFTLLLNLIKTTHCVHTAECATMLWLCPLRLWKIKIK